MLSFNPFRLVICLMVSNGALAQLNQPFHLPPEMIHLAAHTPLCMHAGPRGCPTMADVSRWRWTQPTCAGCNRPQCAHACSCRGSAAGVALLLWMWMQPCKLGLKLRQHQRFRVKGRPCYRTAAFLAAVRKWRRSPSMPAAKQPLCISTKYSD